MGSEESEMERNQIMVLNAKPQNLDLFLNNLTQSQAIRVSPFLFVLLLFIFVLTTCHSILCLRPKNSTRVMVEIRAQEVFS